MKRKLASIQVVDSISPIPDADRIEVLTILGWNVVSQKNLYVPGDKCVYFEIDSVLPADLFPEFAQYKYRVRTVKLRGQISQGYHMPMGKFLEMVESMGYQHELTEDGTELILGPNGESVILEVGAEVTETLKVTKYEPPIECIQGGACGSFPTHLMRETDEIRIQNVPTVVEELAGHPYVITVKCDGTSASYMYDYGEFCCCGRADKRAEGDNFYWKVGRNRKLADILKGTHFGVQGEICGPGIQKNRLALKDHDLLVFNVIDMRTREKFSYDEMHYFCKHNDLLTVPLLEKGDSFGYSFQELLLLADGYYDGTKNWREGIVIRSADYNLKSNALRDYMSFKVISNKFLLNGGE